MKRRESSFALLSLAVILPLLLLSALAWRGVQSQMLGARAAAKVEAEAHAVSIANQLGEKLQANYREILTYEDPPLPESSEPSADPLSTDDPATLRNLRDTQGDEVSPAGLPRRTIAALRIFNAGRQRVDAEAAIRIALNETPSILSPVVFDQADALFNGIAKEAKSTWSNDTIARALAARTEDAPDRGRFILTDNGHVFWISRKANVIRYADITTLINQRKPTDKFPAWASVQYRFDGMTPPVVYEGFPALPDKDTKRNFHISHHSTSHVRASGEGHLVPEVMGSTTFRWLDGMHVEVTTVHPDWIIAKAKESAYWTLLSLLLAVIISFGGLWVIRRVYERERKLNALKSDFVASVSHELRAPIASIRLMADALEDGKIQPNTAGEFHRLISREGARLSTLIENVLDFARIEQGKKQWHREESDLRALVADTIPLMAPLASEKDITLETDLPDESSAFVDPDAIRQALVNLIDNAVKFSPKNSTVRITLLENQIRVSDEGPGIPQTEHLRIFEKFHRLGGELRRETQGTGIGLSLVKAIAEAHGGSITVESEPGRGSTFILNLPAA